MKDLKSLESVAKNIRRSIVSMICEAKSGHPGGSLSIVDILTALYYGEMKIDPTKPKMEGRDRFVLSKGHAAPALYAVLAERGYFPKEELMTLRKFGSHLQGHPDMKKVPGVEISTGSLGQGLSVANGMALNAKLFQEEYRVYVMMGDGELQEGQIWEAAMTAAHYKLDNLCAFVDVNNLQIDGSVDVVMGVEPLDKKWEAFGWNVISIDGHNFEEIFSALETAKTCKGKPTLILAKTVKGKGVSFMENVCGFHGTAPTAEERERALAELA
ncbi:transketolase [Fusobacterium necrophorum subsp. funduliforme]|uniref:Transketolase, thiamine pyrophosphate-binding domain protein n=4 Tax=Fusobacterium necrophorum TaxID=859 RepID=A0AAN3VUN1_9FUSO|nr:transketolase [Fusobacterium necrophorum]AYV96059.1 transketolase [Fusobacterium necrophorum subsp. funduliforme]EFS24250.1 Transketolase, thiamine diphosphate binding domain protein [Fusobacterium necrophorum D12]EJU15865.1 transketolase, thiamine pyrophosphate-binding domain protein [Fusobacterium necrophorum subsp. funduliforme Fnf 1007]EYD68466.1 transketolase subunit A [Fusobacterium necrophorum subsp. funduliforme B35]KID50321.1 transketolase [Fusobacterium necrophorum subsp. fundulif